MTSTRHYGQHRPRMTELTENQAQGRRSRNKGATWMRQCVVALRALAWPAAEIVPSHHRSDVTGISDVALECKDTTRWDDILAHVAQAQFDARERGGGLLPVVWKKTRGSGDPMDGLIIISARDFWTDQAARQARDIAHAQLAIDALRAKLGTAS